MLKYAAIKLKPLKKTTYFISLLIIVIQFTSPVASAVDSKPLTERITDLEQQRLYFDVNGDQRANRVDNLLTLAQTQRYANWYWNLGSRDLRTTITDPNLLRAIRFGAMGPIVAPFIGGIVGGLTWGASGIIAGALVSHIPALVIKKGAIMATQGTNWMGSKIGLSEVSPEAVGSLAAGLTMAGPVTCGALAGGTWGVLSGTCIGGLVITGLASAETATTTACVVADYKPISDVIKYTLKKSGIEPDYDIYHAKAVHDYTEALQSEKAGYKKYQEETKDFHQRILTRKKVAKDVIKYVISGSIGEGEDRLAHYPDLRSPTH
jgi:hypothetical protein